MKLIAFFSRFTLICNISFLLFMFFNKLETKRPVAGSKGTVEAIPFFKDLIIILGFSAIVINFLMCIVYLITIVTGKSTLLPKWIAIINFAFLIVEFYFFFF